MTPDSGDTKGYGDAGPDDDALRRAFELRRSDLDAVQGQRHPDWDSIRAGFEAQLDGKLDPLTRIEEPRRASVPWGMLALAAAVLLGAFLVVRMGADDEPEDPLGPVLGTEDPDGPSPGSSAPERVRVIDRGEGWIELELDDGPLESGYYSVQLRGRSDETLFDRERHDGQRLRVELDPMPVQVFVEVETWIDWMDGAEPERTEVRSGLVELSR